MTSEVQDCLGCGAATESTMRLCSRCAEIVEFEKYYQPETEGSNKSNAHKPGQKRPELLTKMIVPSQIFMMTLASVIVIAAVLCQSTGLDCRLFAHCLLS